MSTAVIIDYGSGNLRSAAKAVERAGADLGVAVEVTSEPERVRRADRVVLPGVGAFGDCRRGLDALPGMVEALNEVAVERARPFLGICVGMQLMATRGLEHGRHPGLDWIAGDVVALAPEDRTLRIPHMGWNELRRRGDGHPILAGLPEGAHAYFVHGYVMACADPDSVRAEVEYGGPVAAVVGRDNLVGTQFHPEKSQQVGLRIIGNFLRWQP